MFPIALIEKVRQWRWIALRAREGSGAKRSERFHRHHPRRKRSRKTLRQERPERLILPSLNVPRRPVINQANSENIFFRLADWNGFSQRISTAHKEAQFKFVIQRFCPPKYRIFSGKPVAIARLSGRAPHRRAARNHRRSSPVIAKRNE